MRCRDWPYGIEDFTLRIEMYKEVYGKYPDEDRANKSEEFVWCDKVGGKVKWFGRCSEYSRENLYDETHLSSRKIRLTATDYKKKKSRDRKNSENKYKTHLKFLSDNLKRYPSPVYPVDRNGKPSEKWNFQNGSYTLGEIARYKRCWLSKKGHGNLAGYYKKMANRAVRKDKNIIHRGCFYKKVYDYWWKII